MDRNVFFFQKNLIGIWEITTNEKGRYEPLISAERRISRLLSQSSQSQPSGDST